MIIFFGFYTPYFGLFIIAAIFSIVAQVRVSGTYNKYSKIRNTKGLTGAEVARQMLERAGIYDVRIEQIGGNLTDHYDPSHKVLRLSSTVYGSTSVAALGVAAHETGHAIQHAENYGFLWLRSAMVPMTRIGSNLSIPLVLIGLLISQNWGHTLILIGIALFSIVVLFSVVTLPVEFDASRRALHMLEEQDYLHGAELSGAKKVLTAAASTYVAATAVAIVNLLRLLALAGGRGNRE
ncbi:MAG TPA: zinc metallopeptidase [Candidatus Coprocola pullicola]|nr:zinc metallopeptidase [Candidatus Coprocola pullicola]